MTHHQSPAATRRVLLASGAAGLAGGLAAGAAPAEARPRGRRGRGRRRRAGAFLHGVASGDPLPGAVVLWTRVTPTPQALPGSGRGPKVTGTWEVARDPQFRRVVRRGRFTTTAGRDHTVKVDATGLEPETWYWYRFSLPHGRRRRRGTRGRRRRVLHSPVGRTRTAPAADATPDHVRLGLVSCANLQAGWFSAYRGLAARDDLHAVVHLGDYLYEYAPGQYGYGPDDVDVRPHVPAREITTLADYRQRHAQYKQDADLQALHAKYPWIVTWDDHESANDAWEGGAENHTPAIEGAWTTRRAWAQRAYDEWMPVRMNDTAAVGDGTRLYRRLRFGRLAELSMLDLRTYRSQQVANPAASGAVADPARTITGDAQMAWLKQGLDSDAQWKVVGNPVMIAPVTFAALPAGLVDPVNDVTGLLPSQGVPYNVDQWDGYTADRREVLDHLRDRGTRGALFVTGDIHSGWASELPVDPATYPLSGSVGVEMVCTSVTSNNLKDILRAPRRTASLAVEQAIQVANRHVKYLNFDDHGFSVLDLTSARAQVDWFVIGDRADRAAGTTWTASWATAAGTNRLTPVSAPLGGTP